MIVVRQDSSHIELMQRAERPVVYLDLWALMSIAEEQAERLAGALHSRQGTLALSGVHIMECARVSSDETLRAVERLLRLVCPRLCFLESKPGRVVRGENRAVLDGTPQLAQYDDAFLNVFVLRGKTGREFRRLDPDGLLFEFREPAVRDLMLDARRRLCAYMEENLELDRAEAREKRKGRLKSEGDKGRAVRPALTQSLFRELINLILRDRRTVMTENDWFDLWHSVVPVSYCDLVVLDRAWQVRVAEACRRLRASGVTTPAARVFSARTIDAFWEAIEA